MLRRSLLAVLVLFIGMSAVSAQSSKLKRAKKYYDNLAYMEAIELYNLVLEKEDNPEAKIYLADSYRKINDTDNAEYWYGQVVRLAEAQPVHKLYYGMMLQRNGKCDLAREWYAQYVEAVPDDSRGNHLEQACNFEEELMSKNANIFEIKPLSINSNMDDFSPAFYKDGLVFASERDKGSAVKRAHSWTGNPFLELFYVDAKSTGGGGEEGESECNFQYGRPKKFSSEVNDKFHEAAVTFKPDQSEIFFTANNYKGEADDGSRKLKIYSAVSKGGDGWSDVQGLPFNSDEYSVAHPSLHPDGNRLFFASDMPGGYGGMDLYYSDLEGNRWSPPINLGATVNTEGHEIFPYAGPNGRVYYSSDGLIGLGGLDIFYIEEQSEGNWNTPINLGFPVNTIADDFGIIFNETGMCGYLSSDRDGGSGGDDIYSFTKTAAPVEIFVYDEATDLPIEGATITDACTGATYITNANGKALLDMKLNTCCNFGAVMEGYLESTKEGCTKEMLLGDVLRVKIPLKSAANFNIEGIVFDQQTGLPLEGAEVELTNDTEDAPQILITDATGQFTFELQKDKCYTIKASKDLYLASSVDNQCTTDLSGSTTLQTNLNLQPYTNTNTGVGADGAEMGDDGMMSGPDGMSRVVKDPNTGLWIDSQTGEPAEGGINGMVYEKGDIVGSDPNVFEPGKTDPAQGGVTFLLHIYYDFDQSYIRGDAEPELERMLTTLNDNPDLIVEIGSHTDSRGSYRYNNRLSQRRAEAVVRWLVERGVSQDRVVAAGYGENVNVNNCSNNIPCSEREHQMNRRTEFKVIGCTSCDYLNETISSPNDSVEVNPCVGCPFDD